MAEGPSDRVEALFHQPADLPPLRDAACADDPGLRAKGRGCWPTTLDWARTRTQRSSCKAPCRTVRCASTGRGATGRAASGRE